MSLPGVVSRGIDHHQRFMDVLLTEGLGIERYFTYVVTKVVKERGDVVPSWNFECSRVND
jgi:Lrp/AsnC family transcriptional regulator of ectoine degradation